MTSRIILIASLMFSMIATAYEIDVGGNFVASEKGTPKAWCLHDWTGYLPFAEVQVEADGVCRLWNAKGKAGAGLRSVKRFAFAKDELVSVSFEACGTGKGGATVYQYSANGGWVGPAGEREFSFSPNWREHRLVFTGRDSVKLATAYASVVLQIRPGADAKFRKLRVERRLVTSRTISSDDFEDKAMKREGAPELIVDHIAPGLLSPTGQGVYHTTSQVALVSAQACNFPSSANEFLTFSVRLYAFGRNGRKDGRLVSAYSSGNEKFELTVEHRAAAKSLNCRFSDGRSLEVPYASLPADFVFAAAPGGTYDLKVTSLSDSSVHCISGESDFFRQSAGKQVARSVVFESNGGEVAVDNLSLQISVPERAGKLEYPYLAKPEMEFDPEKAGWKLVFADEFDGSSMDPEKWEMPPNKIERQRKYSKLEDGKLKILADRLPGSDKLATTGFWSVPDLGYGYFEAKVKFTTYNGWWAAFWLCQSGMSNPFLDGFEIDIFEDYYMRNDERNKNDHNLHVRGAGVLKSWNYNSTLTRTHRDWYRIAVKWTPFEITYYLDGKAIPSHAVHSPYSTVTFDAFRHTAGIIPLKAIVSGQIMKTAYGKHEPTPDEVFPEAYEVDYVRVWQWPGCEPGAAPEVTFDSGAKSHFRLAYGQNVDILASVKPASKTGAKIKAVHLFDDGFYLATRTQPPYNFVVPMTSDYFDRTAWTRPGRSGERGSFEGSTHVFCVFAEDENGMVGHSDVMEFMLAPRARSTPYQGDAQKLPGKVVIGRYDEGGQGIGYYDLTDAHVGNSGNWRPDDSVDGGEHVIGSVSSGEWVNYTVDVTETGRYRLKFFYGTPDSAKRCKVRVLVDGERTAEMKNFQTHKFNDWRTDTIAPVDLELTAGRHVLTFMFTGSYNIGDMEFELLK